MYRLELCLDLSGSVSKKIREHCDGNEQQRNQLMQYWRNVAPDASWSWLAGQLHHNQEEECLMAIKRHVKRAPGVGVVYDICHMIMYMAVIPCLYNIMVHVLCV